MSGLVLEVQRRHSQLGSESAGVDGGGVAGIGRQQAGVVHREQVEEAVVWVAGGPQLDGTEVVAHVGHGPTVRTEREEPTLQLVAAASAGGLKGGSANQ